MSNSVYPVFPGLTFPLKRSPRWETRKRYTASGRRFATRAWTYPIWTYSLEYAVLRRDATYQEIDSLLALFNTMRGGWDYFLYSDPLDNTVANLQIGTGDGSNRDFALLRTIGNFAEPIGEKNVITQVTVNGVSTTAYTLLDNRIVRFNTAPPSGQAVRWSGTYYMRCVFTDDELDVEQFMQPFWSGQVEFETLKA